MKRINIVAIIVVGTLFTGCMDSSKKSDKTDEKAIGIEQELTKDSINYKKDMKEFKKKTAAKIAANDKSLLEFNARIADQKSNAKAEYKKQIEVLNNKNSDLKKKLDDFKTDNKNSWELFKNEFSHDMEELGQAFKNFTIKK